MDYFFRVLITIGNILSVVYNIPQMYPLIKLKERTIFLIGSYGCVLHQVLFGVLIVSTIYCGM